MGEAEPDYRRDNRDIPPGGGYFADRPFDDRPLLGCERFREPWDAREVVTPGLNTRANIPKKHPKTC